MITIPEDTVGRGAELLYPRVSTCLPLTFDLAGDLVGAHLPVGSPGYLIDAIIDQMVTYAKGRPIRAAYAIGMLSEWELRPAPTDGSGNYTWPTLADTVRARVGKQFPVYAYNAREVSEEVVITGFATGWSNPRFEIANSKMFKMRTSTGDEDGEAMKLTSAKVRGNNGGIVQGIKRIQYGNHDVLVKAFSLKNAFRKHVTVYFQNCQEF